LLASCHQQPKKKRPRNCSSEQLHGYNINRKSPFKTD
jgi:hypothetical protein